LDSQAIDTNAPSVIKSNAHLLVDSYLLTLNLPNDVSFAFGSMDERDVDVLYAGVKIGTITPVVSQNKAEGDKFNGVFFDTEGFDLYKIEDDSYLESLAKAIVVPEAVVPETEPEESPKTVEPINTTEEQETKI